MVHNTPAQGVVLPPAGRDEVFSRLFEGRRVALIKMLVVMGARDTEADDAVQSAFVELYKNWETVREPYKWVRRAAKSNFYKIKKKANREPLLINRETPDASGLDDHLPPVEDCGLTVWEDSQWVEQMLEKLSPGSREVVKMILEEFDRKEIADALGCTAESVRQRLMSGRRQLKASMGKDYEVTSSQAANRSATARKEA